MFRCLIYKVHPVLADSFIILPLQSPFVKKIFQKMQKNISFFW